MGSKNNAYVTHLLSKMTEAVHEAAQLAAKNADLEALLGQARARIAELEKPKEEAAATPPGC